MEIAQLVVTSVIALVGLYLANGFRRQQRLKVAEKRISAYRALWEIMEVSRATRLLEAGRGPITPAEAADLYEKMIHCYYASGNGMLFTQPVESSSRRPASPPDQRLTGPLEPASMDELRERARRSFRSPAVTAASLVTLPR